MRLRLKREKYALEHNMVAKINDIYGAA